MRIFRKLTLKDVLDLLDDPSQEENSGIDSAEVVYIEPPEFEGNISGEDDEVAEDMVPQADNVCGEQLKADCEVVFRSGARWNALDEEEDRKLAGAKFFNFFLFLSKIFVDS